MNGGDILPILVLLTVAGEFTVPWMLRHRYPGYDPKTMVMSVLGSPESPVRRIYNAWLIWLGVILLCSAAVLYSDVSAEYPVSGLIRSLLLGIFAVGAGILSGLFSVNESRENITAASRIHGAGSALGFTALLFLPLTDGILAVLQKNARIAVPDFTAFMGAILFFVLFILGDKEQFRHTVCAWEGLWERLTLACMYVPLCLRSIESLLN